MAKKDTGTGRQGKSKAGASDADRRRLRRFLFVWAPVIVIVLVGFYAVALDPSKPTGRTMEAELIGKEPAAGGQSSSAMFRVKIDNGEETVIFIPEKQVQAPSARIVVEEYRTTIFKKRTYRYLGTVMEKNGSKAQ